MTSTMILFGTESGNAEMVADDVQAALENLGLNSDVRSMDDVAPEELPRHDTLIVITSTYGDEGDLPETAEPLYAGLTEQRPDLSGAKFYAFGLGDSSYSTYNRGIRLMSTILTELGASQIGETGLHDAASGMDPSAVALAWLSKLELPVPA